MKRKQATWTAFLLWAVALILAMAGVTVQMVRLRLAILTAQEQAATAAEKLLPPVSSNFFYSVAVEWLIVLIAILAVGALLHLALDLSERRGQFVAAVTHELRTPLTSMIMYSEMLEKGMIQDERKRAEYLATIRAEAEHLQHLIDNVLIHSRLEESSARLAPLPQNLTRLMESILPRLERRCAQADFELKITPPADDLSPHVAIEPMDFERIIVNLVDNATKHGVSEQSRTVEAAWVRKGGVAQISVTDAGPGVATETARRLFEPFFQSSSSESHGGIGLGLTISRKLARKAGGDLTLEASHAPGARFVLTLPACRE